MKHLRLGLAALAMGLGVACVESTACDEYVDYICACHADDPGYDCETLRITYSDPDAELLGDCAVELDDQQLQDEEDGVDCVI